MSRLNDCAEMIVVVHPKSSCNEIKFVSGEIHVKLQAPPIDGKANVALIDFLSKILKIKKSDFSIKRGQRSKHKCITVQNIDNDSLQRMISKIVLNPPD